MPSLRVAGFTSRCFVNWKLFCGIVTKECFSSQVLEEFMLNFKDVKTDFWDAIVYYSQSRVSCSVGKKVEIPLFEYFFYL